MPRRYVRRSVAGWSVQELDAALALVQKNELNLTAASRRFAIPKTTLHGHLHGSRDNVGAGRPTVLSALEEKEIVVTLQVLQEMGFPLTREIAAGVIRDYLKEEEIPNPFRNDIPGNDWWEGFLRRWPRLTERKPQHLSVKRARGVTPAIVDAWIADVTRLLEEMGLMRRGRPCMDYSSRLWNCDETGFCTSFTSKKVIAQRGCREVHETGGGSGREYVTVIGCGSASGDRLPPYILYKGKHLYDRWCQSGPVGALYGVNSNGWMEQSNFLSWFQKMFVPAVSHLTTGPGVVLLLMVTAYTSAVSYCMMPSRTVSTCSASQDTPLLFYSLLMSECMALLSKPGQRSSRNTRSGPELRMSIALSFLP